ncbi:hypothetical protein K1X76_06570 [bacterium]|nr:hypothetical protein [bacterium]
MCHFFINFFSNLKSLIEQDWLKTSLLIIGAIIAYKTYVTAQGQRKLENSLKLIDLFYSSLKKEDIEEWKKIFQGSSESSGASHGHFMHAEGMDIHELPFSSLFAEGPIDQGATDRMAQILNLIASEILDGKCDQKIIYYELGQFINSISNWLEVIPDEFNLNFLEKNFSYLYKINKRFHGYNMQWPRRTHVYSE